MNRREFLEYLGIVGIAAFGLSYVITERYKKWSYERKVARAFQKAIASPEGRAYLAARLRAPVQREMDYVGMGKQAFIEREWREVTFKSLRDPLPGKLYYKDPRNA